MLNKRVKLSIDPPNRRRQIQFTVENIKRYRLSEIGVYENINRLLKSLHELRKERLCLEIKQL